MRSSSEPAPAAARAPLVAEGSFARSAMRLVALFEALAKSEEGVSLAELSATIAAPKSSLLGILRSMVALGYMEHGHGLYRLGPKSFRLAADILAIRRFPNLRPADPAGSGGQERRDGVPRRARSSGAAGDLRRCHRQRQPGALHGADRHDPPALCLGRRADAAGLSGAGLDRCLYRLDPASNR